MVAPRQEPATAPVAVAGFRAGLSARGLADYLESVAGRVWRCRVKTSCTPLDSYPDFQRRLPPPGSAPPRRRRRGSYSDDDDEGEDAPAPRKGLVFPHAFVKFAHPEAARRAARSDLPVHALSAQNDSPLGAARRRHHASPFRFKDARVEVGNLWAPDAFVAAWRGPGDAGGSGLDFVVDPFDGTCRLVFSRDASFAPPAASRGAAVVLRCDVKIEFSVLDVGELLVFQADDSLLLRLSAAPLLHYRTAADDVHQSVPFDLLDDDDDDPWIRTTDITPSGAIGRCWVYRVSFRTWFWQVKDALAYMKGQGVPVVVCDRPLTVHDAPDFGQPMQDLFFCVQHDKELQFPVLFLVNALVHKGIVNEHQLTSKFFALLKREKEEVNVAALTELLGENPRFRLFDVCWRLQNVQDRVAKNPKLLCLRSSKAAGDHNAEVRRLVITPTRAYCMPPQMERSNRVIRHYHQVADRFLRVIFMDEGMQMLNMNALNVKAAPIVQNLMSKTTRRKTTIYRRVQTFLTKGFRLCGRKYLFLAFSSNQLKDRSAWFFAEDGATTVASIREWMGQFPIRNVAKHAARMGLCFTSSYATVSMRPDEVDELLEDVEYNGYNFSDGIGKITPDLAMEVAKTLPLTNKYLPSAYQIRYAGFKGVIAVWPGQNDGIRLFLRRSMRKFESTHSVLEVVSWTKFQPAFLNRQIITLLTSLGVSEAVFWQMQEAMLHNLDKILSDRNIAYQIVTNSCPEHGAIPGLMLHAGFNPATEPHLKAMLLAIKSSQLQGLLKKTKIFVPKGRWLMGCLDELGILEQGQCFIRVSAPSISNCFMQHGTRFSSANKNAKIIVGTVVVAKNPCLHPGDVRILEAVNVPELHHLVDCLVFPKKGERPHANEASGSDLDGDVYFVTWDKNLVPPGKRSWQPMDYSPAEAKQLPRRVLQHDIIDFFLKNMASENIGRISNAHVVHADISEHGAMDEKCIQLAELAATAVDLPKTGKIVTMPPSLRPTEYPDFMEKDEAISYKSEKIIGKLYRTIRLYVLGMPLEGSIRNDMPPYDADLEVPGAFHFIADAWQCKCSYESQVNALLNQCSVRTEAELVTGVIWSTDERKKRKKHEIKERLSRAYPELRQKFRIVFESIAADQDEISDDKKNRVYEMKASAWYQVTYHPNWIQCSRKIEPHQKEMPARLSFAWIAVDYLARIKMRRRGRAKVDLRRPPTFFRG
ncbi:hypothetical protein BS78_07G082900 [Paspalum vaginatum]|nr:hypothetical protein BS78_07G082900 [Paspalum vaginatum]